ncbi:MAG: hypothetical protein J6B12_04050 [Clostridia bacterium]|nr:hypothetical protein [Clostridia bacterium]
MKKFALLLALVLLVLTSCSEKPPVETPDGTEPSATESSSEPETSAPETEPPRDEEKGLRVIVLDQNKDGVNDYKIVVDTEAAKSTEKVPFRLPDADDPKEDSFRTVSMYRLTEEGETLVWYTNLCMGSAPRGGVALKDGLVFGYTFDVYEYGEGRKVSIARYDYVGNPNGIGFKPHADPGSFITNEISDEMWADNFGERNSFTLRNAVNVLDEMLDGAEILLDVTGKEPIYSTDENRFTKQYAFKFDYRDLEGSLAEEKQEQYIIPAK